MRSVSVLFILFLANATLAFAQVDTEQATRETDRFQREHSQEEALPGRTKPAEPLIISPKKPAPEAGEASFFVRAIRLEGMESLTPKEFSSLVSPYENKQITISELNTMASQIEQEYLRRGFVAAVFVPEQELTDGTVVIRVIEARMGDLKIQEHEYFDSDRLRQYWHVPPGDILRYDRISRSIQLMNKNPDREIKAALKAGEKPGTTDVILTAKTQFPLHTFYTLDNEGSEETGKYRKGLGFRHNNFLGMDDILLAGYSFGKDFDGAYVYHNLPVNTDGLSMVYGYSASESHPRRQYSAYNIISEAESASVSLRQDLYQGGEYSGELFAGFNTKDKTVSMTTGTTTRDRLRILSAGGTHLLKTSIGGIAFSHEVAQGLPWFGASDRNNPLASRYADPVFTKINLGGIHRALWANGLQGKIESKFQLASMKLTPQEEFSLGGIDSVRGYPSSDYLADNAFMTNAELLLPAFFVPQGWRMPADTKSLRERASLVAFSDFGWGERKGALATEKSSVTLWSIGFGGRMKLFDQGMLRMEWGFPLGTDAQTRPVNSVFHLSIDFQENILSNFITKKSRTKPAHPSPSAPS